MIFQQRLDVPDETSGGPIGDESERLFGARRRLPRQEHALPGVNELVNLFPVGACQGALGLPIALSDSRATVAQIEDGAAIGRDKSNLGGPFD